MHAILAQATVHEREIERYIEREREEEEGQ
jgi:hypothetical protein